jgi:hypothetical protein
MNVDTVPIYGTYRYTGKFFFLSKVKRPVLRWLCFKSYRSVPTHQYLVSYFRYPAGYRYLISVLLI